MVDFYSRDFDWEEHARDCRAAVEAPQQTPSVQFDPKERWETFHRQNSGKAYKPRRYLTSEFPELQTLDGNQLTTEILEIGCGYGSSIFPILETCPHIHAQVCDLSPHAIDILRNNPSHDNSRCRAFVLDITQDDLDVPKNSVDIVLLVFTLSSIHPSHHDSVMEKIYNVLKPGGILCFRDYGLYDLAMLRSSQKLSSSLYYRQDGTLAYFFSTETLPSTNFSILENEYHTVLLKNRRKQSDMKRVYLHAKLQKPTKEKSTN